MSSLRKEAEVHNRRSEPRGSCISCWDPTTMLVRATVASVRLDGFAELLSGKGDLSVLPVIDALRNRSWRVADVSRGGSPAIEVRLVGDGRIVGRAAAFDLAFDRAIEKAVQVLAPDGIATTDLGNDVVDRAIQLLTGERDYAWLRAGTRNSLRSLNFRSRVDTLNKRVEVASYEHPTLVGHGATVEEALRESLVQHVSCRGLDKDPSDVAAAANTIVTIRFTPDFYRRLKSRADARGVTVSQIVRQLLSAELVAD